MDFEEGGDSTHKYREIWNYSEVWGIRNVSKNNTKISNVM